MDNARPPSNKLDHNHSSPVKSEMKYKIQSVYSVI